MRIFTTVLLKITKEITEHLKNIKKDFKPEESAVKAFEKLSKVLENNIMTNTEKEDEAIEILKQFYVDFKNQKG